MLVAEVLTFLHFLRFALAGLQPLHGGQNRACRGISHSGAWEVGPDKAVEGWSADNLDQCKEICTGPCQAIQYVAARKICRLWNVPVLHSVSMPGSECYVKSPAVGGGSGLKSLKPKLAHCLSFAKDGCAALLHRVDCLSSKDASSRDGEADPCVWCGGNDCHGDSHSGCTSFSMLGSTTANTVSANAFESIGALEVAHCIAASPAVDQSVSRASPSRPHSSTHGDSMGAGDVVLGGMLPPTISQHSSTGRNKFCLVMQPGQLLDLVKLQAHQD